MDQKNLDILIKDFLVSSMDDQMLLHGFKRRKTSLKYERKVEETTQIIDIVRYYKPSYKRDADVHIYPMIQIENTNISSLALRMVDNEKGLLSNTPEILLRQPIDSLAPKEEREQWYVSGGDQELITALKAISDFIFKWVIDFLDLYSSPVGIIQGHVESDSRPGNTERWYIYVAASYLYTNNILGALQTLEKSFSSLGQKRRYSKAFEYLKDQLSF